MYTEEALQFLRELELNNNKPWWEQNKQRYEDIVRTPSLNLIEEMAPRIADISPHYLAIAKKSGGSMMRPFRDIRFSKDKTPYKTNIGLHFKHRNGKDVHAPGFYFHVGTDGVFLGVGMWHPDGPSLKAIRERIVDKPKTWTTVRDSKAMRKTFRLGGESLKRPPRGFDKEHPEVEDLKRKDHILVCDLGEDWILGDDLPDRLAAKFEAGADYSRWLCSAIGQPF
ncbi:MAG: DUF2461 domain-containing protein [Proteobacteria bacterium]|nr:DUF2461 domain-containing protein [Pseudomonadota bacterium]